MICKQAVLFPRLLRLFLQVTAHETGGRRPTNAIGKLWCQSNLSQPLNTTRSLPSPSSIWNQLTVHACRFRIRLVTTASASCLPSPSVSEFLMFKPCHEVRKETHTQFPPRRRSFPMSFGRVAPVEFCCGGDHQRASLARELTTRSWIIISGHFAHTARPGGAGIPAARAGVMGPGILTVESTDHGAPQDCEAQNA